jgi:phage pi2 protein 07
MTKSKKTLDLENFNLGEILLKGFYQEVQKDKIDLWPDEAMKQLMDLMNKRAEKEKEEIAEVLLKNPRLDQIASLRKLHHYAVDLFYETYFGKRSGAPPLNDKYLEQLSMLREQGLSYGQIAQKLGYKTSPQSEFKKSTDKIRKQLEGAKERGITSSKRKA